MGISKKAWCASVAVGTSVAIVGLAAPAALAMPAPQTRVVSATSSPASAELENLEWVKLGQLGGGHIWALKVSEDPGMTGPGSYFLYDPDTEQSAGSFWLGDASAGPTVGDWQSATFLNNTSHGRIEVRFGDIDDPDDATVVAAVTNS
jgi:hypothetical protein